MNQIFTSLGDKAANIAKGFELNKAYTEGTYADTPGNKKLNRVGQKYSSAVETKKEETKSIDQLTLKEKVDLIDEQSFGFTNIEQGRYGRGWETKDVYFKLHGEEYIIGQIRKKIEWYSKDPRSRITTHTRNVYHFNSYMMGQEKIDKLSNLLDGFTPQYSIRHDYSVSSRSPQTAVQIKELFLSKLDEHLESK